MPLSTRDDPARRGRHACRALAEATDDWLAGLARGAFEGAVGPVALVAVGGYGRSELAPGSDLDLVLLHGLKRGVEAIAEQLWYPVWDDGVKLGHAVLTLKQARQLATDELDAATSYLSMRLIHGDTQVMADLRHAAGDSWVKHRRRWFQELEARGRQRLDDFGELAFLLEPDLKSARGGLRDVQTVRWLQRAGAELAEADETGLTESESLLLDARVGLHRLTGKSGDVLRLEDQDGLANMLGYHDADALMGALSAAARSIAWITDGVWSQLRPARRDAVLPTRAMAPGIEVSDGEIDLAPSVDAHRDPIAVLRVLRAAAAANVPISRTTLAALAERTPVFPAPWPAGGLDEFVALLLEGHDAIAAMEAADQMGLWVRVLPEWAGVRNKPQRNAYHRFTVDRHLWEATANAATLAHRVTRPDLLVVGALLHDIGKGQPGDHTDNGIALAGVIAPRLGFSSADTRIIVDLVRHHLLLPDVATRRDLSDDATITAVAQAVGSPVVLELLHALTEADSLATGTSAWGSWKAELVNTLVERTDHVLGGGDVSEVTWRPFPTDEVLALMAAGTVAIATATDRIITVAPDRPGLFSRVAGVLSLHGLAVLGAEAHSDQTSASADGAAMAANEFRLVVPRHGINFERIVADLERALSGELAIEARLAERARTYRRRRALAADTAVPSVRIDNDASSNATVLEVRAPDRIAVLYRITKALAELGLDIRHAKVQTLGDEVVDSFYVQTASGGKLVDPFHAAEVERAVLHAVS